MMTVIEKIARFPSTNGLMIIAIVMWLATCAVALILAFEAKEIPGSWYSALNLYTGTVVVQFGLKRFSDANYIESKTSGKMIAAGILSGTQRMSQASAPLGTP